MKKELTISERGEIAEQMKSAKHFYIDLKLYNEHFPGSKLSVQLAKVNEHNIDSLHGRMIYDLLSKVDQDDIINNRLTPLELANKKKAEIKAAKEAEKQAKEDAKLAELKAKEDADAAELKAKEDADAAELKAKEDADAEIEKAQLKALADAELNGIKIITIVSPGASVDTVTNVPKPAVEAVKAELEETKDELDNVQSELDDAKETIEDLEAEKKSEIPEDKNK